MREILFRGKRKDNGEWVYGDLVHWAGGMIKIETIYDEWEIIPETLGQFTGIHDKNGTKIFEGDNLSLDLNNEGIKTAQVNYRFGCFVFDTDKECYTLWESDVLENHIEVIGNIHEDNNNGN